MEMEMEMRAGAESGRSGDGAAPLAPSARSCGLSFAQPNDEALPSALPVSDEDETSSEHCLIAR